LGFIFKQIDDAQTGGPFSWPVRIHPQRVCSSRSAQFIGALPHPGFWRGNKLDMLQAVPSNNVLNSKDSMGLTISHRLKLPGDKEPRMKTRSLKRSLLW
jgi:hypothetical protein